MFFAVPLHIEYPVVAGILFNENDLIRQENFGQVVNNQLTLSDGLGSKFGHFGSN